ncbi:MAG: hypothetical protein N3E49_09550, partial [Bacteroidia bacterium]|nr:hypothetical protein [Bacteroidia bacterium]
MTRMKTRKGMSFVELSSEARLLANRIIVSHYSDEGLDVKYSAWLRQRLAPIVQACLERDYTGEVEREVEESLRRLARHVKYEVSLLEGHGFVVWKVWNCLALVHVHDFISYDDDPFLKYLDLNAPDLVGGYVEELAYPIVEGMVVEAIERRGFGVRVTDCGVEARIKLSELIN